MREWKYSRTTPQTKTTSKNINTLSLRKNCNFKLFGAKGCNTNNLQQSDNAKIRHRSHNFIYWCGQRNIKRTCKLSQITLIHSPSLLVHGYGYSNELKNRKFDSKLIVWMFFGRIWLYCTKVLTESDLLFMSLHVHISKRFNSRYKLIVKTEEFDFLYDQLHP